MRKVIYIIPLILLLFFNCITFGDKYIFHKTRCIELNKTNEMHILKIYGKPKNIINLKNGDKLFRYVYMSFKLIYSLKVKEIYFYIKDKKVKRIFSAKKFEIFATDDSKLNKTFTGCIE